MKSDGRWSFQTGREARRCCCRVDSVVIVVVAVVVVVFVCHVSYDQRLLFGSVASRVIDRFCVVPSNFNGY